MVLVMASYTKGKGRGRGSIDVLASGALRVRVYGVDPDRFRRQSISGMTVYEERCGNGCGAPEVYPGI